jgi:hypothetical protein
VEREVSEMTYPIIQSKNGSSVKEVRRFRKKALALHPRYQILLKLLKHEDLNASTGEKNKHPTSMQRVQRSMFCVNCLLLY